MFLFEVCVVSTLFCLALAYPADIYDEFKKFLKPRMDESKEQSDDYTEKIADIFDLSSENERRVNLENCVKVICMPHYLCIDDMVVTNGTELFEWRLSIRTAIENKADKLVCGDLEMPCCADEAQKNLHQASTTGSNGDRPNSLEDNDEEKEVSNDGTMDSKNLNTEKCGYRKQQNTATRIINGDEAQPNEFPWVVAIFLRSSTENLHYIGGGSLIHESIILTAAHLLLRYRAEQLVIRAGEHDILDTSANNNRQERNVTSIIEHEHLYAQSLINDIALIVLDTPLKLNEVVNTVCLPPQSFQTDENIMCTSSGWGKNASDRHGKYQATLKKVNLPIVERGKCEELLRKTRLGPFYNLNDSLMCAGGGKRDTCKGDGGSPMFCEIPHDKNRFYQTGIVAGGIGCGRNIPGMYVNLSHFNNWIFQQLDSIDLHLQQQNILPYDLFD